MKSPIVVIAALALGAALAACGGGGSSTPALQPTCTIPVAQYSLVYPAPNATAVPGQVAQVIVAGTTAFPASWDVVLTSNVTLPLYGRSVQTVQPPFPTPNATPAFANSVYQSSAFPNVVLPSGTVFSVFLNDLNSACTPKGPIGSFTTL